MEQAIPAVVGTILSLGTLVLAAIAKWLFDVRASTLRIERRQIDDRARMDRHEELIGATGNRVGALEQRTSSLEGAVFKRPPIMEEL